MKRSTGLIAAVVLAVLALAALAYHRSVERSAALRVEIRGGDGGGLPRAQPQLEHLDAGLLEQATADPAAAGLQAFIVLRHGHVVFERFGYGVDQNSLIDSGGFAPVLVALVAGATTQSRAPASSAVSSFDAAGWRDAIEHASSSSYAQLLSHKVWARLNAASAWIALPAPDAAVPVDCCVHARVQDWLRIGALLTDGGNFEGTQVVSASWITRMRQPSSPDGLRGFGIELTASARGATPIASSDAVFLRGPGHWRLWALPSLHLVVLFGSKSVVPSWDETRLPNLVIAAVTDRSASQNGESLLQQLVPHH